MRKIFSILTPMLLLSAALFPAAVEASAGRFNPKAVSPRFCKLDKNVRLVIAKDGKAYCEVVVSSNRATAFAGQQLAFYLGKIIGSPVKVVSRASGKVPAFILGAPGAKLAGTDLSKLDRDGFIIKSVKNNIIINIFFVTIVASTLPFLIKIIISALIIL